VYNQPWLQLEMRGAHRLHLRITAMHLSCAALHTQDAGSWEVWQLQHIVAMQQHGLLYNGTMVTSHEHCKPDNL